MIKHNDRIAVYDIFDDEGTGSWLGNYEVEIGGEVLRIRDREHTGKELTIRMDGVNSFIEMLKQAVTEDLA